MEKMFNKFFGLLCTKYLVCIKWDLARNILKGTKWDFFFYFMSSHFYKPQQFSQTTFISRNIIALLIYHIHLISKRQHITYWYLPSYTLGFLLNESNIDSVIAVFWKYFRYVDEQIYRMINLPRHLFHYSDKSN